ncbi:MAG: thiamine pyrophosphate-dependent enzyme, partial [Sulfolobaceae archaeon]
KPKNNLVSKKESINIEPSPQQDYVIFSLRRFVKERSIFFEAVSSEQAIHKLLGYRPRGYFFTKTSHLGWALPASIGFALAGGKPLVLIGDGSFNYAPQALWTISKLGLDVKIIVIDNQGYGILRDGAYIKYKNIIDEYWMNPETDTVKISNAYKVEAKECDDIKRIDECLNWLMNDNTPKLLTVKVERRVNPLI